MRTTRHEAAETSSDRRLQQSWWPSFLDTESARLDEIGLRAGVISIALDGSGQELRDRLQGRDRALRLLGHSISPSSRFASTSDRSIAVLHAPLIALPDLERQAQRLVTRLSVAGIRAAVGFAHRRVGEHLLDTWARADAEADRAEFRQQHPDGGLHLR